MVIMTDTNYKNYIDVDEFIDTITRMAEHQYGERQQGILGVIETLKVWPKVQIPDHCLVESVSNVMSNTERVLRYFKCPECGKEVSLYDDGNYYTDRPYCSCGERMIEINE